MGPLTSHFFSQEDLVLYVIKRGDFDLKIWSGAACRKELVCLIHWLLGLFRKNAFLDILEIFSLDMSPLSSNVLKKTFLTWYHSFLFTSTAFYDIFALECTEIKKLVIGQESDLPLQAFRFFFLSFSPFLVPLVLSFLRRWFYWACFQSKNVRESIIRQFLPWSSVVAGNLAVSFLLKFLSIFVHISGSIELITLTSLERSFPPAEFKYRWCQFWLKVMTSEVEQRLTHVAGYGPRSSQWAEMAQSGRIKK